MIEEEGGDDDDAGAAIAIALQPSRPPHLPHHNHRDVQGTLELLLWELCGRSGAGDRQK